MQIDDFPVVSAVSESFKVAPERFLNFKKKFLFENLVLWLVDKYMINSDTSLATVKKFSKNNAGYGAVNIGCFVNDNRAFSSQLQQTRS